MNPFDGFPADWKTTHFHSALASCFIWVCKDEDTAVRVAATTAMPVLRADEYAALLDVPEQDRPEAVRMLGLRRRQAVQ